MKAALCCAVYGVRPRKGGIVEHIYVEQSAKNEKSQPFHMAPAIEHHPQGTTARKTDRNH
eukprot:2485725-Pyramimonas_sp.AAC.1